MFDNPDQLNFDIDVDFDDIKGRFIPPVLTKADKQRILTKRRHREFINDLKRLGVSEDEYYETYSLYPAATNKPASCPVVE
ncbi:hypothetical protein ACPV5G_18235 [Photobacterium damselae]|uniref:hypothetical protein n=1 Tax=Photobacterium damselae TaxID=38293 RepID=UPI004068A130